MPVYEYECGACGHQFEEWQKITDKPVRTCPKCKAKKVERLISMTAFHLKGGGWYSDLYSSSKGGGKGDKPEGDGGKGGDSKGEAKAEKSDKSDKSDKKASASSSPKKEGGGSGTKAAA